MRLAPVVAVAALSVVAAPSSAQITPNTPSAAPRVDFTEQAMSNTISRNLQNRGYAANDPMIQATIDRYNERVAALAAADPVPTDGPRTWMSVLKSLIGDIPWPFTVGAGSPQDLPGSPNYTGAGGSFGAGGAGGEWSPPTCADVKVELDVAGNFVIPSYTLPKGRPITFTATASYTFGGSTAPGRVGYTSIWSDSAGGLARWTVHNDNMKNRPDRRDWYGVIGPSASGNPNIYDFATIAYRNSAGVIVNRATASGGNNASPPRGPNVVSSSDTVQHKECPDASQAGGSFDFYGYGQEAEGPPGSHMHACTWYAPNATLGEGGYAINPKTSIPYASLKRWPVGSLPIPAWQRACLLSKAALAKLTETIWKKACAQPGYNGAPCPTTIPTTDVRDGGAQVNDLGDEPTAAPPADPNAPDTPDPSPSTGGNTYNFEDKCDFAATTSGCSDPGVTAADPTDPDSSFFDPILNWLPDLPSITLGAQDSECPVWAINLTEYGGAEWQFLIDKHCELLGASTDLRATLQALMLALYGIAAAFIILRA